MDKRGLEQGQRLTKRDRGLQRLTSATAVLLVAGLASTGGIAYAASSTRHPKAEPKVAGEGSQGSEERPGGTPAATPTSGATTAPPASAPASAVQPQQNTVPPVVVAPAKPAKRHAVSSGS